MRGIGSLTTSYFEQLLRFEMSQHRIEELHLLAPCNQTGAKFAEHGKVKARIAQFEGKSILPINALLNGFSSLSIRESFDELENANQSQPPGRLSWLSTRGKQAGKVLVLIDDPHLVYDFHLHGALPIPT